MADNSSPATEERISVQLNVQENGDTATSAFIERMRQRGIRPKLRIDLLPLTYTLSRVVRTCTKRWQDQVNPNDSFRFFLNGEEVVDHSTTLETLHRQRGSPRVDNRCLLTLTYAFCSNCRAPPSAEGEEDGDDERWPIPCAAEIAIPAALPSSGPPDAFLSSSGANSPMPLPLGQEQGPRGQDKAAWAEYPGGDTESELSTSGSVHRAEASETACATVEDNSHQGSPVNAVTSSGAEFDDSTCWGACLQGTKAKCTPGFIAGPGHFNHKLCDRCRSGICVPTDRIRAVSPELAASLVTTTTFSQGFFKQSLREFGDAKWRIVNNMKQCSGPMLACFLSTPPPLAWLPLPPEWLSTDKSHIWLHYAYGTLRPYMGRPVTTGSPSMSAQCAVAENGQAVPLPSPSLPTEDNSPMPLPRGQDKAAWAEYPGGDTESELSTSGSVHGAEASETACATVEDNSHQGSPVNAVTSSGAEFDDSTCWGACLQGTKAKCTPGFIAGPGHFNHKLCDRCRSGICVPTDRIRAVSPELAASLVTTTTFSQGFFKQSLREFGDAKWRIVNNMKQCSGPMLACFLSTPPPLAWLPLPPEWLSTDKSHIWLHYAYGTLRPYMGRPVTTGSPSMSAQCAVAENGQAVPLPTPSSCTGRSKRPRTSDVTDGRCSKSLPSTSFTSDTTASDATCPTAVQPPPVARRVSSAPEEPEPLFRRPMQGVLSSARPQRTSSMHEAHPRRTSEYTCDAMSESATAMSDSDKQSEHAMEEEEYAEELKGGGVAHGEEAGDEMVSAHEGLPTTPANPPSPSWPAPPQSAPPSPPPQPSIRTTAAAPRQTSGLFDVLVANSTSRSRSIRALTRTFFMPGGLILGAAGSVFLAYATLQQQQDTAMTALLLLDKVTIALRLIATPGIYVSLSMVIIAMASALAKTRVVAVLWLVLIVVGRPVVMCTSAYGRGQKLATDISHWMQPEVRKAIHAISFGIGMVHPHACRGYGMTWLLVMAGLVNLGQLAWGVQLWLHTRPLVTLHDALLRNVCVDRCVPFMSGICCAWALSYTGRRLGRRSVTAPA